MTSSVSTAAALFEASVMVSAALTFEVEGDGDADGDVEALQQAMTGAAPVPVPPPTGGVEHHGGVVVQRVEDVIRSSMAAFSGSGTLPAPCPGQGGAQLDVVGTLDASRAFVRVAHDEVDAVDALLRQSSRRWSRLHRHR